MNNAASNPTPTPGVPAYTPDNPVMRPSDGSAARGAAAQRSRAHVPCCAMTRAASCRAADGSSEESPGVVDDAIDRALT
jgi:hypothetical protein